MGVPLPSSAPPCLPSSSSMEDDSGDDANAMSFSLQPHNPPMPDFAAPLPQPDQGSGFGIDQDGKATFVAKSLLAGGELEREGWRGGRRRMHSLGRRCNGPDQYG